MMAFGMKKRGGGQGGFIDKRHESSVNGCDSAIVVVPVLSESSFHVFFQKFNFGVVHAWVGQKLLKCNEIQSLIVRPR
jgi:hypothetical protein